MKTFLPVVIAASLCADLVSQTPSPEIKGGDVITHVNTAKQKTRRLWARPKAFLSEDKATFTEGAQQTLTELSKEIDKVAAKIPVTAPMYFLTRMQALRQQHQFLTLKLQVLTAEAVMTPQSGPRAAFEKCVTSLEAAIEQAEDEADVLAKLGSPEKLEAKR